MYFYFFDIIEIFFLFIFGQTIQLIFGLIIIMILLLSLISFIQQINTSDILGVDFYQLIGLQKTDNEKAIVRSFKRFLSQKKRHPTTNERTLKLWRQTQLAYDVIGNPDSRALYDSLGSDFVNVTNFRVVGYNSDAALDVLRQMLGVNFPTEMEHYGGLIFIWIIQNC